MSEQTVVGLILLALGVGCAIFALTPYKQESYWKLWAILQAMTALPVSAYFLAMGSS